MTEQLTLSLENITRLMRLAFENGDKKTFNELAPQRQKMIEQHAEYSLAGSFRQ